MSLLEDLFPSIFSEYEGMVPRWNNNDAPWEILRDEEYGILEQIRELNGLDEEIISIHESADVAEDVKIEGPAYIGPNVEIRHGAYLRKGSWICAGSIVGHSTEIKNSILLPNSSAPHFNYVGDSIIGSGVNLGAGVKISNVRNDRKNISVMLRDGSRINTGLRKMGGW